MSGKTTTEIKSIERLEWLNSSASGNPRLRVHFTDGTSAVTQSDAMVSYSLNNPEFRGGPVQFHFTESGRISYATRVEPMEYGLALGHLQSAVTNFLEGRRTRRHLEVTLQRVEAAVDLYLSR